MHVTREDFWDYRTSTAIAVPLTGHFKKLLNTGARLPSVITCIVNT